MILSGDIIKLQVDSGNWGCNFKFNKDNTNPNSIDLTLSNKMLINTEPAIITCNKLNYKQAEFKTLELINKDGVDVFEILPGRFYLGSVNEYIVADNPIKIDNSLVWFAPMYETRSSIARCGIQTHLTAGFGDYGFKGRFTLEIANLTSMVVYIEPNIRVGQVYYQSVYNGGIEPTKYKSLYNDLQFTTDSPIKCKGEF